MRSLEKLTITFLNRRNLKSLFVFKVLDIAIYSHMHLTLAKVGRDKRSEENIKPCLRASPTTGPWCAKGGVSLGLLTLPACTTDVTDLPVRPCLKKLNTPVSREMILLVYLSLLTNSTPLQRNMSILDLLYFAIRARSRTRFDLSVSFVCKLNLGHSPPPRLYITLSDMPRSLESGEHHVLLAFNRKRSGELMRPTKVR